MFRIIRLIVGILLIVLAVIIALDQFAGTSILKNLFVSKNGISVGVNGNTTLNYKDGERYQAGNGSVDARKVKNLDINWISGGITLEEGSSDTVSFSETCSSTMEKDNLLHWYLDGDTLRIQWSKSGLKAFNKSKDLTIKLPSGLELQSLNINAVSADVKGNKLHIKEITANTVSSQVNFTSLSLRNSFEANSVSGNYTLVLTSRPSSIAFNGVSGNLDLTLPKDTGFTVDLSTVSGNIKTSVPTTGDKKHQTAGNGEVKISCESVSGNVSLSY
ncbi:MAG: DUF4097 family beta strand repeat protein [Spirochaetales bacterium]|nr:DUF4097 family beta strand repeat protein [Candidatus Physcosoma equi]